MPIADRVYHSIKIHAQADARFSYTDPPLAQLPHDLRDLYVPDPGWPWLCWDMDQIEVRLHACYALDRPLLEAFEKGWDVHTLSYCDLFGQPRPPQLVDPIHAPENEAWRRERSWLACDHARHVCGKDDPRRHFGKTFLHRMCKGGEAKSAGDIPAARQLNLDKKGLVRAAHAWLAAHPAIVQYHRQVADQVRRTAMSRTFMGRRRVYNGKLADLGREALAHRDQAGTQDIMNHVFLSIKDRYGADVVYKYGMHDSMTWAVREERWADLAPGMRELAQPTWTINGVKMRFPAVFKEVWP